MSEDPIGFEGGINLYAYVDNDPFNSTDPDGLRKRRRANSGGGRKNTPIVPAQNKQPACGTTAVTANIWYPVPGMGHVSLTLSNGINFGWWPVRDPGWLEGFWGLEGENKSYFKEIIAERRTPEHAVRIYGLDETKMRIFFNAYTKKYPYWDIIGNSCTAVATQTLIAGMPDDLQEEARKRVHTISPSGIIYSPEFHKFAQWVKDVLEKKR